MAASTRVLYDETSLIGALVADATANIMAAQLALTQAKAIADAVTAGGTTAANLEGACPELGSVETDKGQAFYDAIVSFKSAATPTGLANYLK